MEQLLNNRYDMEDLIFSWVGLTLINIILLMLSLNAFKTFRYSNSLAIRMKGLISGIGFLVYIVISFILKALGKI